MSTTATSAWRGNTATSRELTSTPTDACEFYVFSGRLLACGHRSDLNVHFSTVGAIGDGTPHAIYDCFRGYGLALTDRLLVASTAEADWAAKGVTWQAMESMKPGFEGGMTSRVVVGESGPAFSVKDALALDAKLVPLYRCVSPGALCPSASLFVARTALTYLSCELTIRSHMAEYADAQIGAVGQTSNPFR